MLVSSFAPSALLLLFATASNAQFSCTFTATEENSCLGTTADDGSHCVWCAVSAYGFCVNEQQAESMEANIPGVECDRYSSDDDKAPSDDDETPSTDDASPSPNDDALPDNYWTCLKKKDSKSCAEEGCTWCDSKAGFGLCLTGPSADMASDSDWFTCSKGDELFDPRDTSCLMAYMQDPTADGCSSAVDEEGGACLWCSLAGMTNMCLTEEQADMGSQLGITCDGSDDHHALRGNNVDDPYDTSCLLAYLQNPTEDGCTSTVDEDGNACEFCTFQGSTDLCLTEEQAEIAEQIGIACGSEIPLEKEDADPYDPSCALAFLQDQSEATCKSAVDSDGRPCEFCTLQGSLDLCLNEEQAQMGEQLGIECESSGKDNKVGFPSDFWDCLENYEDDGCSQNSCTWCNTEVGVGMCVSDAVADAMKECNFFDCEYQKTPQTGGQPLDPACLVVSADQENAASICDNTTDSEGNACVWCDAAGVFGLCLSSEQAAEASGYLTCEDLVSFAQA